MCMKPRCQVCDMLDTRKKLQFPEQALPLNLEITIMSLIALSIYSCVTGNYILETSDKLRFIPNNHKKSIRDNSRGFPVAVHLNQPNNSLEI